MNWMKEQKNGGNAMSCNWARLYKMKAEERRAELDKKKREESK